MWSSYIIDSYVASKPTRLNCAFCGTSAILVYSKDMFPEIRELFRVLNVEYGRSERS